MMETDKLDSLFLKNSDIVIPKDKWNKILKILENHKEEIELFKLNLNYLREEINSKKYLKRRI